MNLKDKILQVLTPELVWGLGIACPVIPAIVWQTLIAAIINGDITTENIQQFMKDHNIQTYSQPTDFPNPPPQDLSDNNINHGSD